MIETIAGQVANEATEDQGCAQCSSGTHKYKELARISSSIRSICTVCGYTKEESQFERVAESTDAMFSEELLEKAVDDRIPAGHIDILFDGPPDHVAGRFIEAQRGDHLGIAAGEWIHNADDTWSLRINLEEMLRKMRTLEPCPSGEHGVTKPLANLVLGESRSYCTSCREILKDGKGTGKFVKGRRSTPEELAEVAAQYGDDALGEAGPSNRHFATTHVLQFFKSEHLPEPLRSVSRKCRSLALSMVNHLPANPETTVGLRKLLEAKDCFVRSQVTGDVR